MVYACMLHTAGSGKPGVMHSRHRKGKVFSMKKVKTLLIEPMEVPCVVEIDSRGEEIDEYLEEPSVISYIDEDQDVVYYFCEGGKELYLPFNRAMRDDCGRVYDVIAGSFMICQQNDEAEDGESDDLFLDLPESLIAEYSRMFAQPEHPSSLPDALAPMYAEQYEAFAELIADYIRHAKAETAGDWAIPD